MSEKRKIFIIDHDHEARVFLRRELENLSCVVSSFTNGKDALNALEKLDRRPELIILELEMPIMSGADFLKAIEEKDELKSIPTLVLEKPIDSKMLFTKVREILLQKTPDEAVAPSGVRKSQST